ncbi:UDP-N-acetyl glucosamine 2-epimerase [Bryobacterales bacterium F-183]|nr:UDP-N-acetyl glucosamine 2-epimerase [Bryobacterales bacterium F-183]
MITIVHCVGARPNFMKMAPVMAALGKRPDLFRQVLVHTGQHYDAKMSDVFFEQLGLPTPDVNLEVGSASHAVQTAQIMTRFEPVLDTYNPDWVFVPGDVNSTIACAFVAAKRGVKVAHVEAGLRSRDRSMPEELNRILTDQLSDLLFTPSRDGDENLQREGIPAEKVCFVGNVMIDTLVRLLPKALARWDHLQSHLGIPERFFLATLHRPANVDHPENLARLITALNQISAMHPVLFPIHPRTRSKIGRGVLSSRITLCDPLSYLDFVAAQANAAAVISDSGGVQEETTYLGTPCLTLRSNTERPITITEGTNRLIGDRVEDLPAEVERALAERRTARKPQIEYWDGKASDRIAAQMERIVYNQQPERELVAA